MPELDVVRSNLARILRSLGKGEESIVQYKQLGDLEKNLLHLCGLGLTLFKQGKCFVFVESWKGFAGASFLVVILTQSLIILLIMISRILVSIFSISQAT